jgi:uncharacterized protein (TIGR03435 family)
MKSKTKIILLAGLALSLAFSLYVSGQTETAQSLSFEVASIKPALPLNPLAILQSGSLPRLGMTVAGTRVDLGYMTLAEIIPIAYDVKAFQVDGGSWLTDQRFDIQAKMPEGSTREQVPAMLRALLAERFKLKIHQEKREHSVYALVEAKGGHKMKPAEPVKESAADTSTTPNDPNTMNFGNAQVRLEAGGARGLGGGAFTGNLATVTSPETGVMKISMTPDGQMRMEFAQVSMPQVADMLTRMVDKPVLDMTDLKGNYQASIGLSMTDVLGMARATSAAVGLLPPGGGPNPFGARGNAGIQTPQASDPSTNSVFTSIQLLGLQLDSRKAPVDFIVVDQAEKMPTEN